jgi:putative sugar O-methyltransferase
MFFRKAPPEFRGYIDSCAERRVSGWVWDRLRPRKRLDVEIYSAGARIGSTRAETLREDLARIGIGDGRYGFSFELPPGEFPQETIAAKVGGSEFWLLDGGGRERSFAAEPLINSMRRGLPMLWPGLSMRTADDTDIEIAAELQKSWRAVDAARAARAYADRKTMWGDIVFSRHGTLLDLLNGSDPRPLAEHLVGLQKRSESTGLAQGDRAYRDFLAASPEGRRAAVAPFHDMLASLAQYIGLERVECAEQDYVGETLAKDQEALAAAIEAALGHSIAPPTVFDGLYGLSIGDRILHARDIQALYAALRVIEASGSSRPRICEIGGGFGKVAHYAWLRGVRHYTIVDLPSVCAMQYFYLRRTLPDARVSFRHAPTESSERAEGVDLVFASDIGEGARSRSDIVLNCDSFPEMGDAVCRSYFAQIPDWAPLLLSINQEANREIRGPHDRQTIVGALLPEFGFVRRYRFRSWIRRGYAEELWSAPARPTSRSDERRQA